MTNCPRYPGHRNWQSRVDTTATGCALHPNPFGYPDVVGRNGLFLIRTEIDGTWYFTFIDIGRFVVEYGRGHKDAANYPVELKSEGPKPEKKEAPPMIPLGSAGPTCGLPPPGP